MWLVVTSQEIYVLSNKQDIGKICKDLKAQGVSYTVRKTKSIIKFAIESDDIGTTISEVAQEDSC